MPSPASTMSEVSDSPSPGSGPQRASKLSCYICKKRKLRCNKARPSCARCIKSDETCSYPESRKRHVFTAARPRVRDLAAKIHELEIRLDAGVEAPKPAKTLPTEPFTSQRDGLPSAEVVEELTSIFFSKLQSDTAMINRNRYTTSLGKPPQMQPPMCLQYTILAAGASASSSHGQLAETLYGHARQCLQLDEMKDNDHISLAHTQAWILVSHFEAQHLWFSRAAMSIARAVRLGQMLGLHMLDSRRTTGHVLAPAADQEDEQERRNTFWVMFCTDRITSSTGGWPTMMDERSIRIRLPASEDGSAASMTLNQALSQDMQVLSTTACRIVAVHLFNECFDFSRGDGDNADPSDADYAVWQRLEHLDRSLTNALATLPPQLHCPDNVSNTDAVFINLQLHTALICIYQSTATRSHLAIGDFPTIHGRVSNSALQIVTIVALVGDIHTCFRNPLISFAAYITASFFLDDLMASKSQESGEQFMALMELMIDVGRSNMFTAELAVRLAKKLTTSGLDPNAHEKVEMLVADLQGASIAGQEYEDNGIVRLCPLPGHPTT